MTDNTQPLTYDEVVKAAKEYHKQGRLQATLAQTNEDFRVGCFNTHRLLNKDGKTVHCAIGAALNKRGISLEKGCNSISSVFKHMCWPIPTFKDVASGEDEYIRLVDLQELHDDCCTNTYNSRKRSYPILSSKLGLDET